MKYVAILMLILSTLSLPVIADEMGMIGNEDMQMLMNSAETRKKPKNDAEAAEQMQAMLIQRVFLEPMFSEEHSEFKFHEDDEEEEGDFGVANTQDNQMYNNIMMKQMATMLAKKDVLKLSKMFGREQSNKTQARETLP